MINVHVCDTLFQGISRGAGSKLNADWAGIDL
jgi:hypothetical protein